MVTGLNYNIFWYIELNKILKLISPAFYFNVSRKLKIIYVACIIFLLDRAALYKTTLHFQLWKLKTLFHLMSLEVVFASVRGTVIYLVIQARNLKGVVDFFLFLYSPLNNSWLIFKSVCLHLFYQCRPHRSDVDVTKAFTPVFLVTSLGSPKSYPYISARVIYLKHQSDHATPLGKALPLVPITKFTSITHQSPCSPAWTVITH